MKRTQKLTVGVMTLLLVLLSFVLISSSSQNSNVNGVSIIYHDNPLIGNYSFIRGAHGFRAANGFAYSYVLLDTSLARNGSTFTMLPAINIREPSASNFTAVVTYGGPSPNGISFEIFLPVLGSYETLSSNAYAFSGDIQTSLRSGGALHLVVRGTAIMTLFLYLGPDNMPLPP